MSENVSFFSESDMCITKDGKKRISSEFPIWYNRQMVDELSEDVRMAEFEIRSGRIQETQLAKAKERLGKLQAKLDEIQNNRPNLDSVTKDSFAKARKELGKEISARMFTRSDMKKGLADSHEEARRMTLPTIKLNAELNALAKACNVEPVDGKISRTQAEKMWKITSRYLDEQSNSESLRRD